MQLEQPAHTRAWQNVVGIVDLSIEGTFDVCNCAEKQIGVQAVERELYKKGGRGDVEAPGEERRRNPAGYVVDGEV